MEKFPERYTKRHDLGNGEHITAHVKIGVNVWRGEEWIDYHECTPEEFDAVLASFAENTPLDETK